MRVAGGSQRPPAVSGTFYEADPQRLRRQVQECFEHPVGPGRLPRPWGSRPLRALVVPHAGLRYSGPVAAHAYLRLAEGPIPQVLVIIGPDHYGLGSPVAAAPEARWLTPLGEVDTDHPAKAALAARHIALDGRGLRHEHSVEVQLPFLQVLGYRGPVIPVVMADQEPATALRLAEILAEVLAGQEAVMIASTDLSHYLSHEEAVAADRIVLDALAACDGRRLQEDVRQQGITMCGVGPAAAVLEAGRRLGGTRVEVLRYATSGEVAGGRDRVVGYVAASLEVA